MEYYRPPEKGNKVLLQLGDGTRRKRDEEMMGVHCQDERSSTENREGDGKG